MMQMSRLCVIVAAVLDVTNVSSLVLTQHFQGAQLESSVGIEQPWKAGVKQFVIGNETITLEIETSSPPAVVPGKTRKERRIAYKVERGNYADPNAASQVVRTPYVYRENPQIQRYTRTLKKSNDPLSTSTPSSEPTTTTPATTTTPTTTTTPMCDDADALAMSFYIAAWWSTPCEMMRFCSLMLPVCAYHPTTGISRVTDTWTFNPCLAHLTVLDYPISNGLPDLLAKQLSYCTEMFQRMGK